MPLAGLIGRKLGMTQVYTGAGVLVPVTVIQAGPCTVVATRRPERHGYAAAQLGFGVVKPQRLPKPVTGQFGKAGTETFAVLREFRLANGDPPAVGSEVIVAELFRAGERIDVSGVSKGHGTTGVMKRHHFSGFPGSHGTHEYFRHGGSIGPGSFPGRVIKGLRMPGHMGDERVTTLNIEVVRVDPEKRLLFVRGGVPGHNDAMVRVRPSVRAR